MVEKLELKHVAPYLPYGLRFVYQENTVNEYYELSCTVTGLSKITVNQALDYETFLSKPILRPLSDLNGECEMDEHIIDKETSAEICWDEWEFLLENHYDIFGLIEKGLAIDINTLKK